MCKDCKDDDNIIIIVDDETGEEYKYEFVNIVEIDGQKYVIVNEINESNPDNIDKEQLIARIGKDENGKDVFVEIIDDKEFDRVCDYLDKMENKQ